LRRLEDFQEFEVLVILYLQAVFYMRVIKFNIINYDYIEMQKGNAIQMIQSLHKSDNHLYKLS